MSANVVIPENVWDFLHRASQDVGRIEAQYFSQQMHGRLYEGAIHSPIEQIFYVALHTMCRGLCIKPCAEIGEGPNGEPYLYGGLVISPQFRIEPYRVDFHVKSYPALRGDKASEVVVELDGHEFHDKDKRQRSYEKARDRALTRQGYRVLHFTGSDVVRDPYGVAFEVLSALELLGNEEYDPQNPFGID
jgi:very-short-patch-repair endonuclease